MVEWALLFQIILVLGVALYFVAWYFQPIPMSLKGKHVVIVGGSSGIGLAMAHLAVMEGAKLTLIARNKDRLEKAKSDIESSMNSKGVLKEGNNDIFIHSANACSFEETASAIQASMDKHGPISVLICSQGISQPYTFEDLKLETMHEVMDTNYWGCVHALKTALPEMKKDAEKEYFESQSNGGRKISPRRIAIVSSQAGQVGIYGFSHYSASKFALRGFCESLQQEVYPLNIRISLLFPPDTDTPLLEQENKTKPEITRLLSETTSLVSPAAVASIAVKGIKSGRFVIDVGLLGFFMSLCTCGMSPQPFFLTAFLEVLFAGFFRLVAIFVIFDFYRVVQKHFKFIRHKVE